MASIIGDDAVPPMMPRTIRPFHPEETHHPKAIPTPATTHAPKGQVIDDSARGTIFWEADSVEGTEDAVDDSRDAHHQEQQQVVDEEPMDELSSSSHVSGRPFQVEWISTARLPFYRTRGLRNPWNANREVKIARDGTELETSIGVKLLGMFHRVGQQQQQQQQQQAHIRAAQHHQRPLVAQPWPIHHQHHHHHPSQPFYHQ